MELMIVMAIIAIASAVVIPRIGSSDGKQYQAQLRTLNATLNYNRRNAIVTNRPFEMRVFLAEQKVSGRKKNDWQSYGAIMEWQVDKNIIRDKVFSIKFFPQGGATGGTIKLQQGRFVAHLTISSLTGKVSIKESLDETTQK